MLPFGTKNGRFIYKIVGEAKQKECKPVLILFDDIGIGGKTFEEHMELVVEVLRRLEEHGVVVKASKVRLAMSKIDRFGFIIGRDGVKPVESGVDPVVSTTRNADATVSVLGTPKLLWRDGSASAGDCAASQQGSEEGCRQDVLPVDRMGRPSDAGVQKRK